VNEERVEAEPQEKAKQAPSQLAKDFAPVLEIPVLYTGGKILISSDERLLCSSCKYTITVYSLEERTLLTTISHVISCSMTIIKEMEEICNFSLHPSSKVVATFTKNYIVRLFSLESKQVLCKFSVPFALPSLPRRFPISSLSIWPSITLGAFSRLARSRGRSGCSTARPRSSLTATRCTEAQSPKCCSIPTCTSCS